MVMLRARRTRATMPSRFVVVVVVVRGEEGGILHCTKRRVNRGKGHVSDIIKLDGPTFLLFWLKIVRTGFTLLICRLAFLSDCKRAQKTLRNISITSIAQTIKVQFLIKKVLQMSYVPLGLNLACAALIDIICSAALTRPREFPLNFPGSTKVDLISSKEGAVIY